MARLFKRKNTKKNAKVFKHYLELPSEVRMMIVDEMKTADRCKFSRSSKLSNKEAKNSKKYIYSLKFVGTSKRSILIYTTHGNSRGYDGYVLNFCEQSGKHYVVYSSSALELRELWREELDSSSPQFNLHQYAANYFEKQLQLYQNKIRELIIRSSSRKFEIKSLNKLEILELEHYGESKHLISKLHHPLMTLLVQDRETARCFADYEISQVKHRLFIPYMKLNYQQCLQLRATHFRINIGELTENDIFNFIRSWQNGRIGEDLVSCEWNLQRSSFNTKQLLEYLGKYDSNPEKEYTLLDIEHYKERKKGVLFCVKSELIFNTRNCIESLGK